MFPLYSHHTFCMHRPPKLIHCPYPLQFIPAITKHPQIPCQRRRITAHIHNPLRAHFQHCFKAFPIAAFPRRIYHYHIRPLPFLLILFRQNLFRFPHKKLRIVNSIPGCVFSGILNRLGNDFHAIDMLCLPCQKKGNRTNPAV